MLEQRWEILRHYFEYHGNTYRMHAKIAYRVLEEDKKHRQLRYNRYLVKKVKETDWHPPHR